MPKQAAFAFAIQTKLNLAHEVAFREGASNRCLGIEVMEKRLLIEVYKYVRCVSEIVEIVARERKSGRRRRWLFRTISVSSHLHF